MLNFKIIESQKLIFSKGPVVASDTTNLEAKFEVNDLFDGTLRAYWNIRGSVVDSFRVDLDASRICTIPAEVLASISDPNMYGDIDHILQVSVVSIGDDDTIRITSTTCEIPVYKSSYTGNISQPSKPSGDGNITNIITGATLNGKQLDFYNGNNVIFSAPLDRLDSFLLPLLGGKMQGDINMDGNAITGLPDAVNNTDALALAFAKTLFAPSGYGLGEISLGAPEDNDANNAVYNGWFNVYASTANWLSTDGVIIANSRAWGQTVQIAITINGQIYRRYQTYGNWGGWIQIGGCDTIVAQGKSGIWTYRKWASGVAECWGVMQMPKTNYAAVLPFQMGNCVTIVSLNQHNNVTWTPNAIVNGVCTNQSNTTTITLYTTGSPSEANTYGVSVYVFGTLL